MRKILRQHLRRREFRRRRHRQRARQLPHHRIHQPRLRRTRQRLRPLDRVMHDLRHPPFPRLRLRFDQFKPRDKQHRSRREPRRMRDQPRQRRLDPAKMPHHAKHEMLTPRPLRSGQRPAQRFQQFIHTLPPLQPPRHQPHGRAPRIGTRLVLVGTHCGNICHN